MAETEVAALKQALRAKHQALQNLYFELEKEREASATSASEALSMILRLQEEKAADRMEACQYKRMAEEKLRHVEESLAILEEITYRKEMEIAYLEFQVQAYRHKLWSIGFSDISIEEMRFLENLFRQKVGVYSDDKIVHGTMRRNASLPIMRSKSLDLVKWGIERRVSDLVKWGIERRPSLTLRLKNGKDVAYEFDVGYESGSSIHLHKRNSQDLSLHCMSIDEENQYEMDLGSSSASPLSLSSSSPFHESIEENAGIKSSEETMFSVSKFEDQLDLPGHDGKMTSKEIFEVPQNLKSYELVKPEKEATQMSVLEAENQIETQNLAMNETVECYFKDERNQKKKASIYAPHQSELCEQQDGIRIDSDQDPLDLSVGTSLYQAHSQQLNKVLQLLEDNSQAMRQEASDRWNEELTLLTKLREQLKVIESHISSFKTAESSTDQFSVVSVMEAMWHYAF